MANGNGKNGKSPQVISATVLTGRLSRPVDWEMVKKLASMYCTPSEISAVTGVPVRSLVSNEDFRNAFESGREIGKVNLRRMQFLKARDGNPQMLIFLGKNILGQREYWSGELTGKDGGAIEVTDKTRPSLSKLTMDELRQLQGLVQKATPQITASEDIVDADPSDS